MKKNLKFYNKNLMKNNNFFLIKFYLKKKMILKNLNKFNLIFNK